MKYNLIIRHFVFINVPDFSNFESFLPVLTHITLFILEVRSSDLTCMNFRYLSYIL
jgi:hypothetical protein